jgi:hypothetical protein
VASVDGPVAGGAHGWPFGAAAFDLGRFGYVEDEWFFDGEATVYRHAASTARSADGRWEAEPSHRLPYRSRMLVRRPTEPARFNGTVVLCWNNVSLGYDFFPGESPEIYNGGFAFVGVSAQRVGVHGYPAGPRHALVGWDPGRYGSLSVPSDDASYDIFAQAARLVGADRSVQPDPLAGLPVATVIALGASQSATRLATFVNAVHPVTAVLDGYILDVYFGNGSPLQAPPVAGVSRVDEIKTAVPRMPPGSHRLRDDLGVPVLVLNSETEAELYAPARQPDSDSFRLWEVAGAAHHTPDSEVLFPTAERDLGISEHPLAPTHPGNALTMEPVRSAALRHVHRWLGGGPPPPAQPRLELEGEPARLRRDELGIAMGGIRLPDVAAPTGRHQGGAPDGRLELFGSSVPFPSETLRRLYPDHRSYLDRYTRAAQAAVEAGVLLPEDADRLVERAATAPVP